MSRVERDARLALLRARVRDVPDFPKPGILFRDLTPLMGDGVALRAAVDLLAEAVVRHRPELIVAIESRGFIFGAPVAASLGVGLRARAQAGQAAAQDPPPRATTWSTAPTRWRCTPTRWSQGARVVIVDDLLATGGTAAATVELVREIGGQVVGRGVRRRAGAAARPQPPQPAFPSTRFSLY